jgi:transmembrane sensor
VSLSGSAQAKLLKPGEQSTTADRHIEVAAADVQEALAWKNGYFRFHDEPIASVMKKLARWYDVDVQYAGALPSAGLNGKISSNKNLSEVIQALEATGAVRIHLEGRRMIVMR